MTPSSSATTTSPGRTIWPPSTIGTLTAPAVALTVPCALTARDQTGKPHLAQVRDVAHAAAQDDAADAAALERGGEQLAEQPVGRRRVRRHHQDVAGSALLDRDVDHQVVARASTAPSPRCRRCARPATRAATRVRGSRPGRAPRGRSPRRTRRGSRRRRRRRGADRSPPRSSCAPSRRPPAPVRSNDLADFRQRLDHAVQVPSDGRDLRRASAVARAQRLDDLEVLGEGHGGPPGVQGQPELVAHVLPAQAARGWPAPWTGRRACG